MKKSNRIILNILFIFAILELLSCSPELNEFGDIEIGELPVVYTAEEAVENGDYVILTDGTIHNTQAAFNFLEDCNNGEQTYIRSVFFVSGGQVITDTFYNDGIFEVECDSSRLADGAEQIIHKEFTVIENRINYGFNEYFVTDEKNSDFSTVFYFKTETGGIIEQNYRN